MGPCELSIVVPVYNSAPTLSSLLQRLTQVLEPLALASRTQRISLLVGLGVAGLIVVGITAAMESRRPTSASTGAE